MNEPVFKYAQLDKENIVAGISFLSGTIGLPNLILLKDETPNCGDKYEEGKFVKMQTENDQA